MDIVKGGAKIEVSVDKSPRNVSHTKNIKLYPSISPFPPLESDEIIKGLDLVYVAKNLAWKEEPSSDSKLRSVQELQIDNYYPDAVAKYNQILKAGIDNKTKEIEKLADDVKQNDNNARNIQKMFDIEGQKILDQYEHFFEKEKKELEAAEKQFYDFREKNHITRPAGKPRNKYDKLYTVFMFLFLVGLESIFNAGLFSTNLEGGLIAGAAMAGFFSVFNVTISFFFGKFIIPHFYIKAGPWKYITPLCTFAWIVALFFYSLIVGHYRDCLQMDIDRPEVAALNTLASSPFQLSDIFSWLLCVLTIVVGIGAAYHGFKSNADPFPGYSELSEKRNRALHNWNKFASKRHNLIENKFNEYSSKLQNYCSTVSGAAGNLRLCIQDKELIFTQYQSALASARAAVIALIQKFRSVNASERKTKPPAYFSSTEVIFLKADEVQAPDMNLDYKIYAECQAISKSLDDDLPAIKQELLDKYQLLLK